MFDNSAERLAINGVSGGTGLTTQSLDIKGSDGQARISGDRLTAVEAAIAAGMVDGGTLR